MLKLTQKWKLGLSMIAVVLIAAFAWNIGNTAVPTLNPNTQPKYKYPMPNAASPGFIMPAKQKTATKDYYEVTMTQFTQHLGLEIGGVPVQTKVFGYGPANGVPKNAFGVGVAHYPGMTMEVQKGHAIQVKWTNNLPVKHILPVDPSITLGGPETRAVPHVHGGEQQALYDGYPLYWFSSDPRRPANGLGGPAGNSAVYQYPNNQEAGTLWYHDHAMGVTRLNAYAGLAGFWLHRDPATETALNLPNNRTPGNPAPLAGQNFSTNYEYELAIAVQDKKFKTDGQLFYSDGGINPTIHPTANPELFGDHILANGVIWPYYQVEQRKYRVRFLNAAQARSFDLRLDNNGATIPFYVIGDEGGYLNTPVQVTHLLIMPGERYDVILDFSGVAMGTNLLLKNSAPAPLGTGPDPALSIAGRTDEVMQFRVNVPKSAVPDNFSYATNLRPGHPVTPISQAGAVTRNIVMAEIPGINGPIGLRLNGKGLLDKIDEFPKVGATEIWRWINTTGDNHPLHMHLVQYQIIDRIPFNGDAYKAAWTKAGKPLNFDYTPYITGGAQAPGAFESGWKDTVNCPPGFITRVITKFVGTPGPGGTFAGGFAFDVTQGTYVYHCHILDHEENDMMRPYKLVP